MTKSMDIVGRNAYVLSFLAVVGWAWAGIFIKLLGDILPWTLFSGRCLIGLIATILMYVFSKKGTRANQFFTKANIVLGSLMALYYLLAIIAFQLAPVAEIALLASSSPIFTLAYSIIKGHASKAEIYGVALGVVGIAVILWPQFATFFESEDILKRLTGNIFGLLSALSMAVYSIYYFSLSSENKPAAKSAVLSTFVLGSMAGLSILLISGHINELKILTTPDKFVYIAGIAIIATVIPTLLYSIASSKLAPTIVSSIRLLTPFVAATIAYVILGEIPSIYFYPGSALVIIGIFLTIKTI